MNSSPLKHMYTNTHTPKTHTDMSQSSVQQPIHTTRTHTSTSDMNMNHTSSDTNDKQNKKYVKQPSPTTHPTALSSSSSSSASSSSVSDIESNSSLTRILTLEELDPNIYRGYSPAFPRFGRVYGGQTVAQALVAAGSTVDKKYTIHSLHSYFIRPGDDDVPILYQVDRSRDGASFATRRVAGIQKGKTIFIMECSFQVIEKGLQHQYVMPSVPPPEEVDDWNTVRHRYHMDLRFLPTFRKLAKVAIELPFQMDLRRIFPKDMDEFVKPHKKAYQYMWMRVRDPLSDDLQLHQCALAYMSDFALLETSIIPHATHWSVANKHGKPVIQAASIDHAMWFHQPFRADQWLLYGMYPAQPVSIRCS